MAACSCRLIAPRESAAAGFSPRRSIVPTVGSGRSSTRRGISTSAYSPVFARCQLSSDGVAEPSTSGIPSAAARASGHVAGVVPRGALLLERRFVLLVQHDQPQIRRRGEDGAAGADDDRHRPLGDPLPMPMPLGVAQMAVQHGHRAEPLAKPLDRLRRQADFRHQHDRLPPEMDHLLNRLDVDLGFAAAGDAVDENRLMAARVHRVENRPQRLFLIGVEHQMFFAGRDRFFGPRRGDPAGLRADQALASQRGDRASVQRAARASSPGESGFLAAASTFNTSVALPSVS